MAKEKGMHRLDWWPVSLSLGVTFAALSLLCGLLLLISPSLVLGFLNSLTHYGFAVAPRAIDLMSMVSAILVSFIGGFLIGAVFVQAYNACLKHCKYE
ncbi:MAG TPA: DUF5676 family membrane protein [Candidatus Norongarragalinales archaeon]|nr:DUF5676 family membrane protein [Candidatus Norongarragalinales archaeon]